MRSGSASASASSSGACPGAWGMGMVANHGNGYYRGRASRTSSATSTATTATRWTRCASPSTSARTDGARTRVAFSWDWASSGPTTGQLLGRQYASGVDRRAGVLGREVRQRVPVVAVRWSGVTQPEMLERKLSLGNPVLNYGLITWVRYQDIDDAVGDPAYPVSNAAGLHQPARASPSVDGHAGPVDAGELADFAGRARAGGQLRHVPHARPRGGHRRARRRSSTSID